MQCFQYTDDTQQCGSISSACNNTVGQCLKKCLIQLGAWMRVSWLKLSTNKTDLTMVWENQLAEMMSVPLPEGVQLPSEFAAWYDSRCLAVVVLAYYSSNAVSFLLWPGGRALSFQMWILPLLSRPFSPQDYTITMRSTRGYTLKPLRD